MELDSAHARIFYTDVGFFSTDDSSILEPPPENQEQSQCFTPSSCIINKTLNILIQHVFRQDREKPGIHITRR